MLKYSRHLCLDSIFILVSLLLSRTTVVLGWHSTAEVVVAFIYKGRETSTKAIRLLQGTFIDVGAAYGTTIDSLNITRIDRRKHALYRSDVEKNERRNEIHFIWVPHNNSASASLNRSKTFFALRNVREGEQFNLGS